MDINALIYIYNVFMNSESKRLIDCWLFHKIVWVQIRKVTLKIIYFFKYGQQRQFFWLMVSHFNDNY
jgi:hypothetical protein